MSDVPIAVTTIINLNFLNESLNQLKFDNLLEYIIFIYYSSLILNSYKPTLIKKIHIIKLFSIVLLFYKFKLSLNN